MFDLRGFRENNLKMTQAEFANLIGVRQDYVSRLEKCTEQIPLDVLIKIANVTGTTLDELVSYERPAPKPLEVNDTWRTADFIRRTIVDYVNECGARYRSQWGEQYDKYIEELKDKVQAVIKKPKIAIVGHSDVGKSRLINSLLGSEKMPTFWTPTTSIIVYIKHINDRPKYIEEEAWVFRASLEGTVGWDEKKLSDEEYCRAWKLAGGSADILKDYGTRQGEMYRKNEAGAAVIFVESNLLKNCDILDLPGYGTGDRIEDDAMTLKAKEVADVLIYMSHAGQFMQGSCIEYLKEAINSLNVIENKNENDLKPLSNLFVIASHAHTVDRGNPESLKTILDNGCSRLLQTMPKTFWNNRKEISGYEYNYDVVRSRFFTYTTDIERLRAEFEKEIKTLVEKLPQIINDKAKEFIRQYIKDIGINLDREIEEYNRIIIERDKYELILKEIKKNEPNRANENQNRRNDLVDDIRLSAKSSVAKFADEYSGIITVDKIVSIIRNKGFKKKEEDIQALVSYINSTLQNRMQDILKEQSDELKEKIDKYLADFEISIKRSDVSLGVGDINLLFDVRKAFASGLAGTATFGGLAIWASSLGNLGAYILVAKGVSFLSALGISVAGGTAGAAAAVAAIGGPVVLGIALAIIAAIFVYKLVPGGWEKRLAKIIVKEYDSKNCLLKYKEAIEEFWTDTEKAFNVAADALEKDWQDYVSNLEELVSSYNIGDIKKKIVAAEEFKNFLAGILL